MGNMIEVVGPDGSIVEFPADTPRDVMTRALRQHFGFQEPQSPAPSGLPAQAATPARETPLQRAPEEFPPGIAGAGPMRLPRETEPILPAEASIASFVKGAEPYKSRVEALDDAVNLIEEGYTPKEVLDGFKKIGITEQEIMLHGQQRGSAMFQPQPIQPGVQPAVAPSDRMEAYEPSLLEATANTFKRAGTALSDQATALLLQSGVIDPDGAAQLIRRNARARSAAAPSQDIQEGMQAIGEAETFGQAAEAMLKNPKATMSMLVDSLLVSAPGLAATLAIAPAGMVARAGMAGITSGGMEYAAVMTDVLQDRKVDLTNAAEVAKALQNPEILAEMKEKGAKRGLIIGGFNALSMGLAGRFLRPANELISAGKLTGAAAKKATVAAWSKELALQMAGGAGGEFAAQQATGENQPAAVILEALAQGVVAPLEVRSALSEARTREAAARPEAQIARAIQEGVDASSFVPGSSEQIAIERLTGPQSLASQARAEAAVQAIRRETEPKLPTTVPSPATPEPSIITEPAVEGRPEPTITTEPPVIGREEPLLPGEAPATDRVAPSGIVLPDVEEDEPRKITGPVFQAPSDFRYTITQAPSYEGQEPLSFEDADFVLESLLDRAKRGRLNARQFSQSDIGSRLNSSQLSLIIPNFKTDPVGTLEALRAAIKPVKADDAPDQTLSVSGKDKRGDSWSAQYEPMILGDGSVALVRTLTYADGDHSVSHLGIDGTWHKGRPSAVRVKGLTQISGAESFPDVESAMRAAQDDASSMGGQIPAVTPVPGLPSIEEFEAQEAADVAEGKAPEISTTPTPEAVAVQKQVAQEPPDETEKKAETEPNIAVGPPIVYPLVKSLKLSDDVPQFKEEADEQGVVERLEGKFDYRDAGAIQVWQRLNGDLEVISGRHRLDLARRNNIDRIPAQIYREADGFTAQDASILDAELNIRDEQGKVKDYVQYFQGSGITQEEADARGLLGRTKGKRGYAIANLGSPELVAAHRADLISDEAAAEIAKLAPNDARLQAVALSVRQRGGSNQDALNAVRAIQAMALEQATTTDMFGFDDSGIKQAVEMGRVAERKQRELGQRISILNNVSKNPKLAAQEGVDLKNPEAVKQRISELKAQRAAWDNWQTNPDLIAEVRAELAPTAPELKLTGETEAEITAREEAEQAGATEAEKKRQADLARDMFALEGEAAPTEVKPPEQADIFAKPAEPKPGDVVNNKQPAADLPGEGRLVLMPNQEIMHQTIKSNIKPDLLISTYPGILLLSAKDGLIDDSPKVKPDDQAMSEERAQQLLANLDAQIASIFRFPTIDDVKREFQTLDENERIQDVMIVGGKEDQRVMRAAVARMQEIGAISKNASVNATSGDINKQTKQLGKYLRSIEPKKEFDEEFDEGYGETAPEAPVVAPEIDKLQKTYDDANAALDKLGTEPAKPRTERQFFGKNGREGADPETVRRYDDGVKKYNSWKRKYGNLKKAAVDASNALFRATQPTKTQVKDETKLVAGTTKSVLKAKLSDFMVGDQVRFGNTPGVVIGLEGDYVRFRPDAALSPKAYQRVPKKSLTMVARPDTTSEVSYSKDQDSKFGEEDGQLNADKSGLIQLLGANMYASNLADVAIKELLQNSFDAVKGAVSSKKAPALYKTGSIEITVDSNTRTISIKDNARGMTPQIVRDAFFTIAGSEKSDLEPSERSGGLGLAKMGFMLGSDRLQLDTVRDGVRVKVDTTAKDIARDNFKIVKSPAPQGEHGTTVTVTIPENYIDPKTGEAKPIWFPWSVRSVAPLNKPLIGPVKVDVDINGDKQTLPVGIDFPADKYQSFKANFDWGSADIYFGIERKSDTWQTNHQVLSSGVYQFDESFKLNNEKIPYDIIVNVKPNVDARHPDYPFENSRERFKGRLKNDIGSLTNYLGTIARGYEAAGLQESFKGIVSMPRVEAGTDIAGLLDKLKKSFGTQGAQAPAELKPLPKEVTITPTEVRDTRTQQVLVDTQKAAEKEKASTFKGEKVKESKDFMIDLKQDPKLPIFHNNTNVDFVEAGRDYGDPEQFFAELGTLMVEMKEDLAKSGIYGYQKLSPDNLFFAGISIDKDYGGVHIKVPYKAVLINPFYDWGARTLFGVRGNILNTMIHEIAHTGSMDHGVAHNGQMIKVEQYLNDEGLMDYYRDAILDVLRRHESTFTAMRDAYGRSTTKNTAKSLEDVQKDSAAASARGDRGRGADETGAVPAGEGQGRGEGVRTAAASRAEGEVGRGAGEAGRVETADEEERERIDALLEEFNRPDVTGRATQTVRSDMMPSTTAIRSTFKEMIENPRQAINSMFGPLNRGIATVRNKAFFFGAGLEERDAERYGGQVVTSNGEATATLALDNMLHGRGIAAQFIMKGGLRYNPTTKRIEAHDADGSMVDVYQLEHQLKIKLGDERGAKLIQGYLEAKRSKSIRDEMARLAEEIEVQKEALDDARARLRELNEQGASDRTIGQQQSVVDGLAEQYKETKTQLDNIVQINEDKVLMSEEEIEAFINQDAAYPELQGIMDAWTATNHRLLGMMRQVRMISAKRYKQLMAIKDYVPWQRVQDDDVDIHYVGNPRAATNISKERSFKKGKVERPVDYIVDNMTDNIIRLTQSVLRQNAALRIVNDYATRDPETGKIKTFGKADPNKGRFDYISDGRRVIVEIQDPVIAESVYGLARDNLRMNEAIAGLTEFMRRSITIEPTFQVAQVTKDAPSAAMTTGIRNAPVFMASVFGSFTKTVLNQDPVADILRANGIGGFQSAARTPEAAIKIQKGLIKRSPLAATLAIMDHIGDSSDFAARIAAYKRTLAETKSDDMKNGDEALALWRAANVINWNRMGSSNVAMFFAKYVIFANAYMQSIDTLFRAMTARGMTGRDKSRAMAVFAGTTAQLAAFTLLYSFLVGGDDEYEKLDDGTKTRNILIPKSVLGTENGILVPMNTSASFMFKALPELTYNMLATQATKTPMDATRYKKAVAEAAADSFLGPEPIPTVIRPIVEISTGRSFFTERPLVPRGMESMEKFRQYTDQTSEIAKLMGKAGGLSPIEYDHLIRGTLGTAGLLAQYGSNLVGQYLDVRPEPTAKQAPFVGRFIAPTEGRGREDLFYDLYERVRKATSTLRDLEETGEYKTAEKYERKKELLLDLSREMNRTEAKLKKINTEIRMLSRGREEGTAKERRKEIDLLQRDKSELLEGIELLRKEAGL